MPIDGLDEPDRWSGGRRPPVAWTQLNFGVNISWLGKNDFYKRSKTDKNNNN